MKKSVILILTMLLFVIGGCENEIFTDLQGDEENNLLLNEKSTNEEAQANYYARLIINAFNSTRSSESEAKYHPSYGGCYLNHNGKLVVLIANKDNDYKKYIKDLVGPQNVIFRFCDNSYNSLLNVVDSLNNYKLKTCVEPDYSNFRHYGVRTLKNRVEVYLDDFTEHKIQQFKNKTHDSPIIVFSESEGDFILESVNPGGFVSNGVGNSSIGYRAKDINGNIGIVTSGHGIKQGQTVFNRNGTVFGYCSKSTVFGNVDAAFVEVYDGFILTNNIEKFGGILNTNIVEPQVGTSVSKVGITTGLTRGTVLDTNDGFDGRSIGGTLYFDLVKTNYNSAKGDSGGIIFTYLNNTAGIHVGASGGFAYYCKANNINRSFGINRY